MNAATIRFDEFWSIGNPRLSSAEDVTFLLFVAVILVSALFAAFAPEQKQGKTTTIEVRIKPIVPSDQIITGIPEMKRADPPTDQPIARQDKQIQPPTKPIAPAAKNPTKRLDLTLHQSPAPFKQFGVTPKSNLQPDRFRFNRKSEDSASIATTYEPYVSVFGDIEVGISDRCTLIMGSNISLFDDRPRISTVRCKKRTGQHKLEQLFQDIRRRRQ